MAVREYSGTAQATSLSGGISASATSIALADATGWPTGATGPFVVTINAGASSEEKVLCTSRAGNTLTASSRGWDGTTASDHENAESVQHTISATDLREANAHVNDTTGDPHPQYLLESQAATDYLSLADAATDYATNNEINLPPGLLTLTVGSPSRSAVASYWGSWLLDGATNEVVSTAIKVPPGWTSCEADVYWTNTAAAAGNVVLRIVRQSVTVGDTLSSGSSGNVTTAAGGADVVVKTTLPVQGVLPTLPGKILLIGLERRASDAADTLVADIAVELVVLRRTG